MEIVVALMVYAVLLYQLFSEYPFTLREHRAARTNEPVKYYEMSVFFDKDRILCETGLFVSNFTNR
jgi:hypothetical protein